MRYFAPPILTILHLLRCIGLYACFLLHSRANLRSILVYKRAKPCNEMWNRSNFMWKMWNIEKPKNRKNIGFLKWTSYKKPKSSEFRRNGKFVFWTLAVTYVSRERLFWRFGSFYPDFYIKFYMHEEKRTFDGWNI